MLRPAREICGLHLSIVPLGGVRMWTTLFGIAFVISVPSVFAAIATDF